MGDWSSMSDASKDGTEVLVSDGKWVCTAQFVGNRWVKSCDGEVIADGEFLIAFKKLDAEPCKWMHLPSP